MNAKRADLFAVLILLLSPLLLLGPCVFGSAKHVPFDLAQFPPVHTKLTSTQLEEVRHQQNADVTEVPVMFMPEWDFASQELAAGRIAHWNPFARGGSALLASGVDGFLYPLNWVLLIPEDPVDGLAAVAYLNLLVAGLLMFGFLRAIGIACLPALFGALAFEFSGTLFANLHFYQRAQSLIWLPGMLWASLRIAQPHAGRWGLGVAALAVCMGMTWLAGFPPYAAASTLVVALFAACLLLASLRKDGPRPALRMGLLFALGGTLGLGLACVQLIPMLEFFPESNRTPNPSLIDQANGSWDLSGLLGFVMPDPFGHPNLTAELEYARSPLTFWLFNLHTWTDGGQASAPLLPKYNYIEYTVFPGTLVLLFALAGLFTRGPPMRWFAAATILLLVTLACGPSFLKLLYQHVPPMNQIPPMRFIGPVAVLVATLAAIGLHNILSLTRRRWLGIWTAAIGLSFLFFGAWLWTRAQDPTDLIDAMSAEIAAHYKTSLDAPNITAEIVKRELTQTGATSARHVVGHQLLSSNLLYVAIALALASLWWALHGFGRTERWRIGLCVVAIIATTAQLLPLAHKVSGGREIPFPHDTQVHAFLRQQRDAHRADGGFTVARASNPGGQLATQLPPDTLAPERIRDLNIYTFTDARAHLPFLKLYGPAQLIRGFWVNALPDDERLNLPFMDLLGLRYILSATPLQHAGRRVGPEWKGPGGEFFIYERDSALPRAIVVPRLEVKPDEAAVIEALLDPDLEPRAAALITQSQHRDLEQQLGQAPAPRGDLAGQRSVRFLRDHPADLQLEVDAGEAGYLVLNDTFMPGWSATVNGQPAAMARANLNRRVVPLPAERAMIEMRYTTPGLLLGALISLVSLCLLIALSTRGRTRPPRDTNQVPG